MKSAIEKYLSHYAEPESVLSSSLMQQDSCIHLRDHIESCLVIPTYNEPADFIARLKKHPHISQVLLILVINQPEDSMSSTENKELFGLLRNSNTTIAKKQTISLIQTGDLRALIVDRFSEGKKIPIKQGVGLARKIGADIACQLYHDDIIQTKNAKGQWIFSSDADTHLPDNYFELNDIQSDARVFNFRHIADQSAISHATHLYEQAIKYYKNALEWSESPYAFYTLGSVLAFQVDAYCKVRGFPKRPAGEDFYLLNKLVKQGKVNFDSSITVQIESRISERVPFGTGPAVKSIIENYKENRTYTYYNPEIFCLLKIFIRWSTTQLPSVCATTQHKVTQHQATQWREFALNTLSPEIIDTIDSIQFEKFISHASRQCRTQKMFIAHFHNWFDGFKTLKFIHYLQNKYLPPTTIKQCIAAQKNWKK